MSEGLKNSWGVYRQTFSELARAQELLREPAGPYSKLAEHKLNWAKNIFQEFNIEIKILDRNKISQAPALFVGNHISYLDIPLLFLAAPQVSFVAKKEISTWPLFGTAAKAAGTVFVDRGSVRSRGQVRETISQELKNGKSIAIFPSGTTTLNESAPWKKGAFEIAQRSGVRIQPFRISYSPERSCAYIDDDFFLTHLIRLGSTKNLAATIEFHEPLLVTNPFQDCQNVQRWVRGGAKEPLELSQESVKFEM